MRAEQHTVRRWAGRRCPATLALLGPALALSCVSAAQSPSLSNRLLDEAPELTRSGRVRGPADFSRFTTKQMWVQLPPAARRCSDQVLDAQLSSLRTESRNADHTFLNCRIEPAREWTRQQFAAFARHMNDNRPDLATRALGRATAAVQSFYTYTNFVELMEARGLTWDDAVNARGQVWSTGHLGVPLAELRSHYNPLAAPNDCGDTAPSLDHSSNNTSAGRRPIAAWGRTAHEAAAAFAQDDMEAMLTAAYQRRPNYGRDCGQFMLLGFIPWSWAR